jgi:hypothetical protein
MTISFLVAEGWLICLAGGGISINPVASCHFTPPAFTRGMVFGILLSKISPNRFACRRVGLILQKRFFEFRGGTPVSPGELTVTLFVGPSVANLIADLVAVHHAASSGQTLARYLHVI